MTSAVAHNETKLSMFPFRRLTANTSGASGPHSAPVQAVAKPVMLKRKSDEISDAIEDEIRVWASSSAAPKTSEGSTAISVTQTSRTETEVTSATLNQNPEQRPAKRLRKIVESVGYVALGGATLFGALVLSAPDFL